MRTVVTVLTLIVMALVSLEPTAWAGPDDDRKAAEKLVSDGLTLARAKKFREAIGKFEEALKLYPHPEIQHNLARAHEELGELREAYDLFTQALKQDYTYATDARSRLPRIEAELRKSYARLTVRTTPSQVAVVLQFPDGTDEAHVQTPFATWVPAGKTKITGTNPNFKTREEQVDLAAGEDRDLQLVLQPLPRQGFLLVRVNIAGATVALAGQPIGKSPLESFPYEAGVYQLEVRARGYKPDMQEVVIVQDEVATVNVSLEVDKTVGPTEPASGGVPSWIGWTLVGTGAVAGGVATYLQFGKAFPTQKDANALPVPPAGEPDTEYQRLHKKAVGYQTAAIVTGLVGVALVGTGVFLLLAEDGAPAPTDEGLAPRFVPTFAVGPDGGSVGAILTF
ncbi:MAG: PEGA domain-containing protein [Myxococcota bacterium]